MANQNDIVSAIMLAAGRFPVLSPARQLEYAYRVRKWLDHPAPCPPRIAASGRRAKARLLETNLRLVIAQASRYKHITEKHPERLADLIQEGTFGLNRAIEKFDPTRGYNLSTYAVPWIRQAIGRNTPRLTDTIRKPLHIHEQHRNLSRLISSYEAQHGIRPPIEWLSEQSGLSHQQIRHAIVCGSMKILSLDQPVQHHDGDGSTLAELIADEHTTTPDDSLHSSQRAEQLQLLLQQLPDSDRDIITAIYFNGARHSDCTHLIGGLSRSSVGLRKNAALEHLKRLAEHANLAPDPAADLRPFETCQQCGQPFRPVLPSRQVLCGEACRIARKHTQYKSSAAAAAAA